MKSMNPGHLRKVVFLRLAFEIFKGTPSLVYNAQKFGFISLVYGWLAPCPANCIVFKFRQQETISPGHKRLGIHDMV